MKGTVEATEAVDDIVQILYFPVSAEIGSYLLQSCTKSLQTSNVS